jgi:hypothetical protein
LTDKTDSGVRACKQDSSRGAVSFGRALQGGGDAGQAMRINVVFLAVAVVLILLLWLL